MEHHSKLTREINLVIIGQTSAGKSKTANTIYGENVFQSTCPTMTSTSKLIEEPENRLTIVDTPGFSHLSEKEFKKEIINGIHGLGGQTVFLYRVPMNRQGMWIAKKYEKILGKNFYDRTIVVFTYEDQWLADLEEKGEEANIESYISTIPEANSHLLKKCNYRYVVLQNVSGVSVNYRKVITDKIRELEQTQHTSSMKNTFCCCCR